MTTNQIVAGACLLAALGTSGRASAQPELGLEGTTLRVRDAQGERTVELGCTGTHAHAAADRVFVACGEAGVALVELATDPARVLVLPQPAPAQRVFVADGMVWARLADGTARPIAAVPAPAAAQPAETATQSASPRPATPAAELAAPTPAPEEPAAEPPVPEAPDAELAAPDEPPAPATNAAQGPVEGRVTRVAGGRALIHFEGIVEPGMVVELRRSQGTEELSLTAARPLVGRGVVEVVEDGRARVVLETNAMVQRGDYARTAGRGGSLWLSPPLPSGVFAGAYNLRAFLPINTLALGVMMDLSVGYLFALGDMGLRITAELTNLGFALFGDQTPVGVVGHGFVSFVTRWFELGAGLGAATIPPSWMIPLQTGFSIAGLLRIGSEDGLMLRLRTNVVLRDAGSGGGQQWTFGDLHVDSRIPIGQGVWILLRGGGGSSGLFAWDGGVRLMLIGNGRDSTLFLNVAGGLGWINVGSFNHAGPMLSAGVELRL